MSNSHRGSKTHRSGRVFRDRDPDVKAQGEEAMPVRERFGAQVQSNEIALKTLASPYPVGRARLGLRVLTDRPGMAFGAAGRVRGSRFGVPFLFLSLPQPIANNPAIARRSAVEQWKQIPRKAESDTPPFR